MSQQRHRPRLGQNRLSRRRAVGLAATGAGAGALLAACAGGKSSGGSTSPASGGQTNRPKPGGTLNFADSTDPQNFDPSLLKIVTGRVMLRTNDSLLSYKSGSAVKYDEMVVQPGLSEKWETPDSQTYTFHLNSGIKFANLPPVNGRPLTAEDIKWTYEYVSRTGQFAEKKLAPSNAADLLAGLDQVQTPDPNTAVVKFKEPFAPFVSYAASQWLPILAHEIFDADGDFSKRAVGTGPFQLDMSASQQGARWVYKKNLTYYRSGLPYLGQLTDLILVEDATQNAAFLSKQLDLLDYEGLTLDTVEQITKAVPGAVRYDYPDQTYYYLYIDASKPPLDDQRIRQAISLCIDRDAFIKTFANRRGEWALAASRPGLFTESEVKQILKYDPAQAKQLVSQAGYSNGVDIEVSYTSSNGAQFAAVLQLLQSQLRNGNINVALKPLEIASSSARRRLGDFQVDVQSHPFGLWIDLDGILYPGFYPNTANNWARVNDPPLTSLLVQQRHETDSAKRSELWRQAVKRINEAPWALALFFGTAYQMWHPYVKNYAPNLSAESYSVDATEVWLSK